MKEHETQRSAASQALISLRAALGKTQAGFAVEVMKCAVTTIARWETNVPPRGEALLTLAKIADREAANEEKDDARRRQFQELGNTFRALYLHDAVTETQFDTLARFPLPAPNIGFLLVKLQSEVEYWAANSFLTIIAAHRGSKPNRKLAAAAIKALNKAAEQFPEGSKL